MWIVLGGLTFFLSFGYFFYQRRYAAWIGESWQPPRHWPAAAAPLYLRSLSTGKKGGHLKLGLDCPAHFDFQIGPERGIDKFFKSVGLTHELQLEESGFDESVYVGCDDLYFIRLLKRSPAARSAIHGLMTRERGNLMGRINLFGRGGRVWLQGSVGADVEAAELAGLLQADADDLLCLQQALTKLPTVMIEPVANRMRWQAAAIATVAAALASCAVVGWAAHVMDSSKQLAFSALLWDSVLLSAVLWLVLVGITVLLLVRTARFHLVLLEVVLLGSWGMFGSISNAKLHINMAHDASPAVIRCVEVVDKRISRTRKGGRSYYVQLASWQLLNGEWQHGLEWKVSSGEYESMHVGSSVTFAEYPGRLGFPWLDDLTVGCRSTSD
ncbi:MAG TPA: hypothetical protein VFV64_16110 [Permianibacter sp.]|nr:hypothetical protein [Permianibacter sp.]